MRVLIADDHPVVRQGLKQILLSDPDVVVSGEARDGDEALDLARRVDWDVAIIDFSMPGLHGLDLIGEITREFPTRPVLVLSMHPESVHATRVLKAGGAGYLNKESAAQELNNAIRKVASGGKYLSPALSERLALDLALESRKPPHESLSDHEYRIMWLLASGKAIGQIAREMSLSPSTVSTYRTRILKKLGLSSNAELVRYAVSHCLVD
jgi:two-component system, NarL family, invasion response regulator UvrY